MPTGEGFVDGFAVGELAGAAGEVGGAHAVDFVGDTDFEFAEGVENVEFGDGETVHAVDADGVATDDGIKPTTTAFSAGGGSKFGAAIAEGFANSFYHFGGEGAFADAGGVGFGDTDDAIDDGGANSGADAGAAGDGVGGGDVGIGSMIEVKEGSLSAFKEDVTTMTDGIVDAEGGIDDMGPQTLGVLEIDLGDLFGIEGRQVIESL